MRSAAVVIAYRRSSQITRARSRSAQARFRAAARMRVRRLDGPLRPCVRSISCAGPVRPALARVRPLRVLPRNVVPYLKH